MFLHWSIIHSLEGVWNVSVITFTAFFCNKRGAQTVTQSVYGGWMHMQRCRQADKVMDGGICWLRKLSDLQIKKLRLARTGPFISKVSWNKKHLCSDDLRCFGKPTFTPRWKGFVSTVSLDCIYFHICACAISKL